MKAHSLSPAAKITIIGLVGAAIGIWIQSVSGVPDYPSRFPPGPIILVLLAVAVVLGSRWWWTPIFGAALSLLITVGAFVLPGTRNRLSDPSEVAAFTGTLIQMIGLVLGLAGGIVATIQNYLRRTSVLRQ
jgi:hypothetical protein